MIDAKKDIAEVKQEVLEVKSKLAQIEESRNVATQDLLLAERSKESLPEETTRVKIRRLVNQYCNAKNADQRSVWYVVYDRLYYRYGISLRSIVKKNNENMLDVAERLGHLDKIFAICSNELV
jgi:KaiC/GvpD/RAD55 family RecA-like ATPase